MQFVSKQILPFQFNKYYDLAGELKKLWKMKMMVILTGTLGMIPKDLEKQLREMVIRRIETIQRLAVAHASMKKISVLRGVKNLQ